MIIKSLGLGRLIHTTLLLVWCFTTTSVLAQESTDNAPSIEDQAVFEWLKQLGFADYTNLPLVKVATGWWTQSGNDEPKNSESFAFLMNESEGRFKVVTFALAEVEFEISPPGTPAHRVVKFERVSLAESVRTILAEHAARLAGEDDDHFRRFGCELNEGSEFVILAAACAAQNEPTVSRDLMIAAGPLLQRYRDATSPRASLQEDLSKDLANMTMWRIILGFGNTSVTRSELLARLEKFLVNYPNSTHVERARETAELLAQMLAEDQAHETPKDFEELTTDEKVAELIFQLREQNGQQWSQPGSCDIFSGDWADSWGLEDEDDDGTKREEKAVSPAQQLVDIGIEAVPQLIESLEDRRFSRSVGYHRNFYFSHHVLRVGDCAEQILCKIANRNFYRRTYTNAGMIRDGEQMSVKEQVEEWWKEVQTKGEKQVLIEGTVRGDSNSPAQAERLIAKYPDEALETVVLGATNTQSPWIRKRMIILAGSLGEPAAKFLAEEVEKGPSLTSRLAAARQLAKYQPDVARTAMIREWKKVTWQAGNTEFKHGQVSDSVDELIDFLAHTNSLDAIQALHEHFRVHLIAARMEIVSAFDTSRFTFSFDTGKREVVTDSNQTSAINESVINEIEALLMTALEDIDRCGGRSGFWGDCKYTDPRICDEAGYVLACRFPDKYVFDPKAGPDAVESQRIKTINIWRKQKGIELLPEYQPRKVERLPDEQTMPLMQALLTASGDEERAAAMNGIANLGIGALPAILETIRTTPAEAEGLAELRDLARKLSLTVTLVTIKENSLPFEGELKEQIDRFQGKPLSETDMVDLLLTITNRLPEGATGIRLTADRTNAESGLQMTFELTKHWPAENGSQQMWNHSHSIVINNNSTGNTQGSFSLDHAKNREAYSGFSRSASKALNAAADTPFFIRYSLIRDE